MVSPKLQALLDEILKIVPVPKKHSANELLEWNRKMQEVLFSKAYEAAEREWPGFAQFVERLCGSEAELYPKAGPRA